jgi:Uma2 family endonuclease
MPHAEIMHIVLPEPAYDLWVAGELHEVLGVPDGTRVEIIGGEIVVSPSPQIGHNKLVYEVSKRFVARDLADPSFPWRMLQVTEVNLTGLRDGYVPDLIALSAALFDEESVEGYSYVQPDHVGLAVEITSPSNAADDRKPGRKRTRLTKWSGYAFEGIPFYLLIDRDPKIAKATLYSDPDRNSGRYQTSVEWAFGETVELPDPFGVQIETAGWQPWAE